MFYEERGKIHICDLRTLTSYQIIEMLSNLQRHDVPTIPLSTDKKGKTAMRSCELKYIYIYCL